MMESCALSLALVYRWDFGPSGNTHHHLDRVDACLRNCFLFKNNFVSRRFLVFSSELCYTMEKENPV